MPELLLATRNPGKLEEIRNYLRPIHPSLRILSMDQVRDAPAVVEDGSSFLENARKKAKLLATFTRIPTLADDSGLEVDVLGGRPGVLSARFAGPNADDKDNIRKLLEKLKDVPAEKRTAHFRCVMALYGASGISYTATGDVCGLIIDEPRGTGGFGYDPIFFIPALGRTFAEITPAEKNRFSHRALAVAKISDHLTEFLAKL
ncbi:MAG TPA: RdgB/HAM1 family non-canonical purine NTP pyrophosphatase [Bdellovibrionota bacterium]|nr:RdgB/HAM1 family non-canonical purine NTP pyrophosphatase [Bdellovibrionota bacterium]